MNEEYLKKLRQFNNIIKKEKEKNETFKNIKVDDIVNKIIETLETEFYTKLYNDEFLIK